LSKNPCTLQHFVITVYKAVRIYYTVFSTFCQPPAKKTDRGIPYLLLVYSDTFSYDFSQIRFAIKKKSVFFGFSYLYLKYSNIENIEGVPK